MDEYINREVVLHCIPRTGVCVAWEIASDIRKIPAADVVERKKGKWIYQVMSVPGGKGQTYAKWRCSWCKMKFKNRSKFCPECGADMREGNTSQKSGRRTGQCKREP